MDEESEPPHPDQKSRVAKQKFHSNNLSSRIAQPTKKERPPHSKKWMTCEKGERCPGETDPTLNGQRYKRRAEQKYFVVFIDSIPKTTKPIALNFDQTIATGFGSYYRRVPC